MLETAWIGPKTMMAHYGWETASDAVDWGGACHELLGLRPEELPTRMRTWRELVAPDDHLQIDRALTRFLREREPLQVEYTIIHSDGSQRRLYEEAAFVAPTRVIGSVSRVRETRCDQQLLAEFGEDGLAHLLLDHQDRILAANRAAHTLFGYAPNELPDLPIERLVQIPCSSTRPAPGDSRLRHMTGRSLTGIKRDGQSFPLALAFNPIGRGPARAFCTVLDPTMIWSDRDDLARFFEITPDLFCIADLAGYFRQVNANFVKILGHSETELLSRPFLDFVHPDDQEATTVQVTRLKEGLDVIQFRNRYLDCWGAYRWFEWTAGLAPEGGRIFAIARDVTDRMAIESQLMRQEVRERAILDHLPALIHVRDREGRVEFCNQRFAEELVALSTEEGPPTNRPLTPQELQSFEKVLRTKAMVTQDEVVRSGSTVRNFVTSRIPLIGLDGEVMAVASVSTDITEQLQAREAHRQMEMARIVQQKLYPSEAPVVPEFDIAGSARPVTQLCGDYYDYVHYGDGRIGIVVGDVSGHGLGPALQMVELRALLRLILRRTGELAPMMKELNRLLCHDLPDSMFISLFLAELDPVHHRLRYVAAGHSAWLFHRDGSSHLLKSTGTVLGLLPDADFGEKPQPLHLLPGDVLLISTDGIIEAMNSSNELYGNERLLDIVHRSRQLPSREILQAIFADIHRFVDGAAVKDDMTAIVVKSL